MTASSPADRHEISIVDGRFMHATCTCGWRSAGKRERSAVRNEAEDHLRLYAESAPASEAAVESPRSPTAV